MTTSIENKVASLSVKITFPISDQVFESWTNLEIEEFLQISSNISYRNDKGETILHLLTRLNRRSVIKKVIDKLLKNINEVDNIGNTPFLNAAKNGNGIVSRLLKDKGAKIGCTNDDNVNALHLVVATNNLYLTRALISWGVPINTKTKREGHTPLMLAMKRRREEIINHLLDSGAKIDIKCNRGRTAFWYAVSSGDGLLSCVKRLLEMNADLNVKDDEEVTPLMIAAKSDSPKIIKLLLLWGTDINAQCKYKKTALHYAAFNGNLDSVKRLMKARPKRNVQDINGRTALMAAIYNRNDPEMTYLLAHNVKPNIQCKIGRSALHYASAMGCHESCRELIEAGAIIDLKDKYGKTPFILAATHGYIDVVKYLYAAGADINMQDNNGKTALLCLAGNTETTNKNVAGNRGSIGKDRKKSKIKTTDEFEYAEVLPVDFKETIDFLISLTINVNDTCNVSLTALHYAALTGFSDCVIQLLKAKAAIDATDTRGETPLHKAASRGQSKVIAILLTYGAEENKVSSFGKSPYDLACMGNHNNSVWLFKEAIHEIDNEYPQLLLAPNNKKNKKAKFSEKRRLEFLEALVDAIDNNNKNNASLIQVRSVRFCNGKLLITTVDEASKQWLIEKIKKYSFLTAVVCP